MKIKLSKSQWEQIGKVAGWTDHLNPNESDASEAEHHDLSDMGRGEEMAGLENEQKIKNMKDCYSFNKGAKINADIICPACWQKFNKKAQAHAFCCKKCKDVYWNTVVPERTERAKLFNR